MSFVLWLPHNTGKLRDCTVVADVIETPRYRHAGSFHCRQYKTPRAKNLFWICQKTYPGGEDRFFPSLGHKRSHPSAHSPASPLAYAIPTKNKNLHRKSKCPSQLEITPAYYGFRVWRRSRSRSFWEDPTVLEWLIAIFHFSREHANNSMSSLHQALTL